jgi:hypothetical protein
METQTVPEVVQKNEIPLMRETPPPSDLDRYFEEFVDHRNDSDVKATPELAKKAQSQYDEAMKLEEKLKELSLASVPVEKAKEVAEILRRLTHQPLSQAQGADEWDVYTELPGGQFHFSVEFGQKPYKKGNPPERAGFFNAQEKASICSGSSRFFTPDEFTQLTTTLTGFGAVLTPRK